jgi:hypothetical protein
MKQLHRLILACAALATCTVASAQTIDPASDQERRMRNREEALAKYNASQNRTGKAATTQSARADETTGKPSLGERARSTGESASNFTERQVDKATNFTGRQVQKGNNFAERQGKKARDFTARQEQRLGKSGNNATSPNRTGGTPQ